LSTFLVAFISKLFLSLWSIMVCFLPITTWSFYLCGMN